MDTSCSNTEPGSIAASAVLQGACACVCACVCVCGGGGVCLCVCVREMCPGTGHVLQTIILCARGRWKKWKSYEACRGASKALLGGFNQEQANAVQRYRTIMRQSSCAHVSLQGLEGSDL